MTSPLISEALMETTWRRVASSSPGEALLLQKACGKEQEELTGFMIGFSSDLRRDAAELVIYFHVVLSEAFRKSGAKFRKITPGKIVRTCEQAKETLAPLEALGPAAAEKHAELTSEPAVFRYLVSAMTEDSDDSVRLADDEFWHILHILKTVSDCLHDAQKAR
jgi:hypothetical protein